MGEGTPNSSLGSRSSPRARMKTRRHADFSHFEACEVLFASIICVICAICGSGALPAAQKPQHTGIKLEGYATVVTPTSITVFAKKNQVIEILTRKDYTSLVAIAAPVTVWYTNEGGVNHLEDIVYPPGGSFVPANLIGENIKRLIILPQPEGVENSPGLMNAISQYFADNAGWYVAPPELAREIANRHKASTSPLDAIDPNTGNVDMQRYLEAQRSLVTVIANETRSDAVLEVKLIKVKAKVHASIASWDDMTEPAASRKSRFLSPLTGLGGKWLGVRRHRRHEFVEPNRQAALEKTPGVCRAGRAIRCGQKVSRASPDGGLRGQWRDATLAGADLGPVGASRQAKPRRVTAISPELQKQIDRANQAGEKQK